MFIFRITPKAFIVFAITFTIILCVFYTNYSSDSRQHLREDIKSQNIVNSIQNFNKQTLNDLQKPILQACTKTVATSVDIDTMEVYRRFNFQPSWMPNKEYWDDAFEKRYKKYNKDFHRPPLKVFIVPHSHSDPGWLKTFENYYEYSSRQTIQNMVDKMHTQANMTFIWPEIAFLNLWWDDVHPTQQKALRKLVQAGRIEVTTGGWVMTDEATSHLYGMVDQLIEGHQWMWHNLGVKPKSGWAVDPFGHGNTLPYLLSASGLTGTVIQRIHYAWKQWLAWKQSGDFQWTQVWDAPPYQYSILTHNQPFDIYSIKHSCGPHPSVCLSFDFRKVQGEYTEYSARSSPITDANIKQKSELLLEQYARTGSLYTHNTILVPLGDDFRYNLPEEWEQQYSNYMKIINYINSNEHLYRAHLQFGTPKDYFEEIRRRQKRFPSLAGDFFVYSDIFSDARPAYWSGYFTTRPYLKLMNTDLEHSLRSAEIIYTIALNIARRQKLLHHLRVLERSYENIVKSRRNLALFQHHDAITGTSKALVMRDYGLKLFQSLHDTVKIQQDALHTIIFPHAKIERNEHFVVSDFERQSYDTLPHKLVINLVDHHDIVLYNSLAKQQEHLIRLHVNTSAVEIFDENHNEVIIQVNPIWHPYDERNATLMRKNDRFEVIFIAKLAPLSLSMYTIKKVDSTVSSALVYCHKCEQTSNTEFRFQSIPVGDIQLENHRMKLLINGQTGLLKTLFRKRPNKPDQIMQLRLQFAAYQSAQSHSGAYLFKPDPNEYKSEKDVLHEFAASAVNMVIVTGPILSQLTVIYGAFLVHTVGIFHIEQSPFYSDVISIENLVDFGVPPKNRETELFMRFRTNVQNGNPPVFYTDANGFQMQKRIKVEQIGIEGNYYPITRLTYLEDDQLRLNLLVNHAMGAASWLPGYLEVMLDRRTLYDDGRGMGEGLIDNRRTPHKFFLIVEDVLNIEASSIQDQEQTVRMFNMPTASDEIDSLHRPSSYANQMSSLLSYPANVFLISSNQVPRPSKRVWRLLTEPFPVGIHLLNLRTQPDSVYSQYPSNHALMILHALAFDCRFSTGNRSFISWQFASSTNLKYSPISRFEAKSLTGLHDVKDHTIENLGDVRIRPMTLMTLNVTF